MIKSLIGLVHHIFGLIIRLVGWFVKDAGNSRETHPSTQIENKPLILYKNESPRLAKEFKLLETENKNLRDLVFDLANYTLTNFNKSITLTMVIRTQREQDEIYAGKEHHGRKYDEKPWKSPHQFGQAVDIRSRTFSGEEIKLIEDYLNAKYNMTNYYKWTAKNHNVGLGDHFHIQYYKAEK